MLCASHPRLTYRLLSRLLSKGIHQLIIVTCLDCRVFSLYMVLKKTELHLNSRKNLANSLDKEKTHKD